MKLATLNLQLGSDLTELIYRSLEPELEREHTNALVEIKKQPNGLLLQIQTEELSTLRAALNSYIRWINCICSINNVIHSNQQ
ncbi:MAG: hypothetical protein JSV49_09295 [Thermoplasmata archaeon]|nr:MAG: hypothetical protein JSV49_09295 [Thermoplasmata archaeon]